MAKVLDDTLNGTGEHYYSTSNQFTTKCSANSYMIYIPKKPTNNAAKCSVTPSGCLRGNNTLA